MHKKKIEAVQERLFVWLMRNARIDLPWRHTKDLYHITVAEIMLQQTNVSKVLERYEIFLKKFPTVTKLACAQQATVLRVWQGLGYNRRALNLHKMAKIIMTTYDGNFPETEEKLGRLPGVGPYTRSAVLIFGRNVDTSAVDVNIDRVIRRLEGCKKWCSRDTANDVIAKYVPIGKSSDWHNGLMDFASIICTKRTPKCNMCPLGALCVSYPDPQDNIVIKKKEIGRSEKGKHIPRRIYRGRIIEYLRDHAGSIQTIGKAIKSDWNGQKDKKWLLMILEQLEKESMIKESCGTWKLK